ncbi:hypothetical protein IFM89_015939 [Coptis chinensis]|uniref:Uncharacterized protein n=1 Tax=Coptis chinensis TaxID=261450 RepID=A0A835HB61_9MAGN|nr:hypothetical protein IFM89_015939 [Coptis chinensis]
MDLEEVVHSEDETPISTKVERRVATVMHYFSGDWDGIIIRVHFDGKGRPICRKVCNKLYGWEVYLFVTQIRFDIDIRYRKSVLKSFGVRWRTFKNMLTVKYIMPFKDDPEALSKPPAKYKLIKKADWDAFVKLRLTEEFQEKSKLQSARRAKGKYNHRVSRLGYAGLIDKMQEELGESFDEDDRASLWLLAWQNKNDEYFNDDTRKVAEKIVSFEYASMGNRVKY